jgi:AcrR family transcriptional regulator
VLSSSFVVSVDLNRGTVKNTKARVVRKRTSSVGCPEVRDRRVRKTTSSLRSALIGLARELPYHTIAVKDILARADVGRSTFYTHFRDKDELLESGVHELLRAAMDPSSLRTASERAVAFSLPILTYVGQHRCKDGPKMTRAGRVSMHARMQDMLVDVIQEDVAAALREAESFKIPVALVAQHVAATFVRLLNWWVDTESPLMPEEIDAQFRALVLPALAPR